MTPAMLTPTTTLTAPMKTAMMGTKEARPPAWSRPRPGTLLRLTLVAVYVPSAPGEWDSGLPELVPLPPKKASRKARGDSQRAQ